MLHTPLPCHTVVYHHHARLSRRFVVDICFLRYCLSIRFRFLVSRIYAFDATTAVSRVAR